MGSNLTMGCICQKSEALKGKNTIEILLKKGLY